MYLFYEIKDFPFLWFLIDSNSFFSVDFGFLQFNLVDVAFQIIFDCHAIDYLNKISFCRYIG